jgi:hypothetical protein
MASLSLALVKYNTPEYTTLNVRDAVGTERLLKLGIIDARTTLLEYYGGGHPTMVHVSLLYFATQEFWSDGIALFLQHGADPSQARPEELKYGAPFPDFFLYLLALLDQHPINTPLSDPNYPPIDQTAPTALIYAAKENKTYAVRFLVEHRGADPRLRDSFGRDALYYAMEQIERQLYRRAVLSACEAWQPLYEEAQLAYEENIFAALVGPSDPVQYEEMFPRTVARLREMAARQHLRHLRDAVGHTRPSAAAARMLPPPYGRSRDGLHCSGPGVKRPRSETVE